MCKHEYSKGCPHPSHSSKEVSGDHQGLLIRTAYFRGQQTLTHEIRMVFTILNVGKKREEHLVTCENYIKWKFESA